MLQIVVLEKTLESLLDIKEIKPANPKGNQPWIFIGRTDADAEMPILWLPDAKNWLIWKDSDVGQDWKQRRRGWQRVRGLDGITNSMDVSLRDCWHMQRSTREGPKRRSQSWGGSMENPVGIMCRLGRNHLRGNWVQLLTAPCHRLHYHLAGGNMGSGLSCPVVVQLLSPVQLFATPWT